MATITLSPTSASGTSWSNTANVYDGNTSTSGTVSVASNNYADRFLTCNFDTSVIPSGATINSATLTVIAKQSSSRSTRRITPQVDINGDSSKRVIEQQLTTTSSTTLTADVSSYMSDLTSLSITPSVSTTRSGTFTLYEVYIDVDYTIVQTYTVTFKDYNGNVLNTQTVEEGRSATNPGYPSRDGYLCIGWDNDYSNVTSDIDVTAQYVQEQSVPSNNIMTTFDSADWTFLNFNAIERKANSLSGTTSAAWGGFYLSYPDSWKGKDITIGFNETEGGVAGVNVQSLGGETNYLSLNNIRTSGTVNIPTGTTNVYIVINRSEIGNAWITGLYAREVIEHTVTFKNWNGDVLKTETVEEGSDATPPSDPVRDGYRFTGWNGVYTNITADTDITAQYIKIYNIVASAGTGGTISPSGTTTVDEGSSQTYIISANTGYGIKDVLVDDISQGEITSYTFTDVTANHTLSVIFKEIPRVIAAIKKNVFYANNIYEGYDNFAIGKDGVYLNAIYEDLNEDENIYLDKNGILHVYQFIEDINYGIFNPETDLIDFEYESDGSGSYTLTGWKGTLNGKPSTEMIIPDNENIIL